MEFVFAVRQKPPSRGVPQCERSLQLPVHPDLSQYPTFRVALMHIVFGASMHDAPPLYTVHTPPQTFPAREAQ